MCFVLAVAFERRSSTGGDGESTEEQSLCDLGRRKRTSFQSASLSAVSPHEDKGKEGDVMEEEFRRVFGESSKEVVEREIGEESASESEEDRDGSEPEGGGRAQLGPRSVQELVPPLCEGKSRITQACEKGAERGRRTDDRDRLHCTRTASMRRKRRKVCHL